MSIANRLYNYFITLSPISHLNEIGKVKPQQEYRHEMKAKLADFYGEHEQMLNYANTSYAKLVCQKLGAAMDDLGSLKLISSVTNTTSAIGYSIVGVASIILPLPNSTLYQQNLMSYSPVSHIGEDGQVKTKQAYRTELKTKIGELYVEHSQMEEYDNSSYSKLFFDKLGRSLDGVCSLNPITTMYNGSLAASYGVIGVANLTANATSAIISGVALGCSTLVNINEAANVNDSVVQESCDDIATDSVAIDIIGDVV